jgi:SAM-dependent methyltransferase
MDKKLITKLKQLNKKFYTDIALEFDKSRSRPWKGWDRLFQKDGYLVDKFSNKGKLKILDIGCGNGRFGKFLIDLGYDIKYTGIDFADELLNVANRQLSEIEDLNLVKADILEFDWEGHIENDFDLIVMFGLLHHIPGLINRKELIQTSERLLHNGGYLIFTVWQAILHRRFKNKRPSDQFINESLGLDTSKFEKGDFILDWQRGKVAYRYSHYSDPKEVNDLISDTSLEKVYEFDSDGKPDNLNKYYIFHKNY